MIRIQVSFSVEDCRKNPEYLYVFGDNLERVGKGGQAIIRNEPNTVGLATKYSTMESYSDDRLQENMLHIESDINRIKILATDYKGVIFPAMGLGTGLAALQSRAPRTFMYLCKVLLDKFNFNNMAYLVPLK